MPLVSLLIGVLVAVVAAGAPPPPSGPQQSLPVRVISTTSQIDFPSEVSLRLEAEAERRITEVTLFYRLGRQNIRIYGYPAFTPSKRVSADFTIKTGGSSFLPSGTDIEYYYLLRDRSGNSFETERFSVEYKDPSYDWQRLRRGDVAFLWHDRPVESVDRVATDVARQLEEVKSLLGLKAVRPMKAVILNSGSEATRSFPLISQAATRDHLYAGFAYGDYDVFVLVGLSRDGIVHEMTHLLVDEAVNSPLAMVPSWLNEGLAMYFESASRGRESTVLRAARGGDLMPLRGMGAVPGRPEDVRLFYAQAQSIVRFMMEAHGRERMAALLRAMDSGKSIERAVQTAYGMSLDELERKWQRQLGGDISATPAADPGTLGTSVIVAGAVVVAVVAVVFRWLRHISNPPDTGEPGP